MHALIIRTFHFFAFICEGFTTPKVWEWKIFPGVKDKSYLFIYHMKAVVDPGEGPGGAGLPPVFLNQTEARRADEFFFFWDRPFPCLILGSGWPPPPPSPPYLTVWIHHWKGTLELNFLNTTICINNTGEEKAESSNEATWPWKTN